MTIQTIRINPREEHEIIDEGMRYLIRSDKYYYRKNHIIQLQMWKDQKPSRSRMDNRYWLITTVKDRMQVPLEKGHQIIGFRELER